MLTSISRRTSLLLLSTLCLTAAKTGTDLTPTDREEAQRYLAKTQSDLFESVRGLSDAQWRFKPGPDRWSVAEVVEHLALIEGMVRGIVSNIDQAPAPPADRDVKAIDAMLLAKVPDRSNKAKAPEGAVPTGRWTPAEALQHFRTDRAAIAAMLRDKPGLRDHAVPHPAFGPIDGYEWILATAGHTDRHIQQIREVKADAHFPGN